MRREARLSGWKPVGQFVSGLRHFLVSKRAAGPASFSMNFVSLCLCGYLFSFSLSCFVIK